MVRFVGFFRPVRGVSFKGEVGAENACGSELSAEKERGGNTAPMLSDRFLTFLAASETAPGFFVGTVEISRGGNLC